MIANGSCTVSQETYSAKGGIKLNMANARSEILKKCYREKWGS